MAVVGMVVLEWEAVTMVWVGVESGEEEAVGEKERAPAKPRA